MINNKLLFRAPNIIYVELDDEFMGLRRMERKHADKKMARLGNRAKT